MREKIILYLQLTMTIRLVALLFLSSCTLQTKKITPITEEELKSSEINKQNFGNKVFLGFSFDMDSLNVMQHCNSLIQSGKIWDFYLTQSGRDRMYMNREIFPDFYAENQYETYYLRHDNRTNTHLKIDDFGEKSTFATKLILQKSDTSKNEEIVQFGISIYRNKLRSIDICISGKSERIKSDIRWKDEFDILENNLVLKYGEPIICNDENRIWVNGIINIELKYDGIKNEGDYGLNLNTMKYDFFTKYYPYYIMSYRNIVTESQAKKEVKQMMKQIEDEINQISEQDRLNNEFNPSGQW